MSRPHTSSAADGSAESHRPDSESAEPGATGPFAPDEFCAGDFPLTPRGVHRAAVVSGGLMFSLPSLVFLAFLIVPAWVVSPGVTAAVVTGLALGYGVVFLYACGISLFPATMRLAWYGISWLLLFALAAVIGENVLYMIVFQSMITVLLLPWRRAVPALLLVCGAAALLSLALGVYIPALLALVGMLMAWGVGYEIQKDSLQRRLEAAEQRNAVLAVAAERERIGRDLHDILGHSLTTVTVNAQLAQRLLHTDPAAAREQLEQIEHTVRQVLSDVRMTASGMQQVRAAGEIASARSVLAAAGIEADAPTALPDLDDARAALFGYVIREGVTNIVRHSGATRARIYVEDELVSVDDDGTGIPPDVARSGLTGLRRRVEDAGGRLRVETSAEGTHLTASFASVQLPGRARGAADAVTASADAAAGPADEAASSTYDPHHPEIRTPSAAGTPPPAQRGTRAAEDAPHRAAR